MGRPPFDQRELTVLFSALLLAAASVYFRRELRRVPEWGYLLGGVCFFILGSTATIVEHAFAYDFFNAIEHATYLAQSLMLALWALKVRRAEA